MGLFASLKRLVYLDEDLDQLFDAYTILDDRARDIELDVRFLEANGVAKKKGPTNVTKKPVKKGK